MTLSVLLTACHGGSLLLGWGFTFNEGLYILNACAAACTGLAFGDDLPKRLSLLGHLANLTVRNTFAKEYNHWHPRLLVRLDKSWVHHDHALIENRSQ